MKVFLQLVRRLENDMQIFLERLGGKTLTLQVKLTDTVENIKAKIPQKQRLIFLNRQLDNGRVLAYYKIYDRCTLHLTRPFFTNTQIFVRTPSGQTRTIDLRWSDYIGIIKENILRISNDQRTLFFVNREWEDDRTLPYYIDFQ